MGDTHADKDTKKEVKRCANSTKKTVQREQRQTNHTER